jgi:transcriptional regulator with GAF, ATPase, and Fis domain
MGHEQQLSEAFVALADSLVADYDVVDLLTRLADQCVALLDVDAAGLMLADQRGSLGVVAASSDATRVLELLQLQYDEGPCLDCYRTAAPVAEANLEAAPNRWPLFTPRALAAGYRSVHALPMRLRTEVIGTLNLFSSRVGILDAADARIGQALADVSTIAILQERAIRHGEVLAGQLQTALTSRIVIEQAKGVVAERGALAMDEAFERIRGHARNHNERLTEVAARIVDGSLDVRRVLASRAGRPTAS